MTVGLIAALTVDAWPAAVLVVLQTTELNASVPLLPDGPALPGRVRSVARPPASRGPAATARQIPSRKSAVDPEPPERRGGECPLGSCTSDARELSHTYPLITLMETFSLGRSFGIRPGAVRCNVRFSDAPATGRRPLLSITVGLRVYYVAPQTGRGRASTETTRRID
jgi:hypothetical protein